MKNREVLLVDDDRTQAEGLADLLRIEGFEPRVYVDPSAALEEIRRRPVELVVTDMNMPGMNGLVLFQEARKARPDIIFLMITAYGSISAAVKATQAGIFHYLTKPVDADETLDALRRAVEVIELREENAALKEKFRADRGFEAIVGTSRPMRELIESVQTVAASEATVLIRGESGTGKELIADAIHAGSPRFGKRLVKVNCAAVPETLLESELFGHEKGAFTGATSSRAGRFEQADGGTLFLDEIGDLPLPLQVKLLRVLQEQTFERVGGTRAVHTDVRIITATHRVLEAMVRAGEFRSDLYYRVNVIPLRIPPLRERAEDIPLLASHFLQKYAEKNKRNIEGLSSAAMEHLLRHSWPGNVRELENLIERAVVLSRGSTLEPADLPIGPALVEPRAGVASVDDIYESIFQQNVALEDLERGLLSQALQRSGGNQARAARLLGLSRRTLQYRAIKYNLLHPDTAGEDETETRDG